MPQPAQIPKKSPQPAPPPPAKVVSMGHGLVEVRVANQAYVALRTIFAVIPISVGVDKYFHFFADWNKYLSPQAASWVGGHGDILMRAIGVMEIIIGIGVALKPSVFGYVVSAWLCGIILNLLLLGGFYDVALRDVGLAFAAAALARLGQSFQVSQRP